MQGGYAVVTVVFLNALQQILTLISLPQFEPILKLDYAGACVPQVYGPAKTIEWFEALDRVAFDGCPHSLANRAVKIHKDVSSQELVNLFLASAVAAGEPLDR